MWLNRSCPICINPLVDYLKDNNHLMRICENDHCKLLYLSNGRGISYCRLKYPNIDEHATALDMLNVFKD